MVFSKLTTRTSGNGGQYSSRNGAKIDRIILHHCASTSLSGVLNMMATGSRTVSSNYVVGNNGEIVGVVPEEYRAWTSSSASWDGRAVTVEIINETAGPDWRISEKAFDAVARLMADVARRHKFKLNRDTMITHQELYTRYGASYATACPGPYLQSRVDQLIALANKYLAGNSSTPVQRGEEDDDMWKPTVHVRTEGNHEYMLAHPELGKDLKPGEKRKDGDVTTVRGYQVTTDPAIGKAWARMYARGFGQETSRTNRADYIKIQEAAQRVSLDII